MRFCANQPLLSRALHEEQAYRQPLGIYFSKLGGPSLQSDHIGPKLTVTMILSLCMAFHFNVDLKSATSSVQKFGVRKIVFVFVVLNK